ncbi:hypothetical protein [Deinococcus roseus]|uniref:Uncharacterized protein n=1 Tax=Deinococcus roseus TaxID=392414 RepID=A0ABQ2D935_9DEIO|nr:hypothetical protein [Deinococcus roseus]GGJ48151.1 hypothetical protein GCM10008938_37730 [Deinococcus roseus]
MKRTKLVMGMTVLMLVGVSQKAEAITAPNISGIPGVEAISNYLGSFKGLETINKYLQTACDYAGSFPDFRWICNIREMTGYVDDLLFKGGWKGQVNKVLSGLLSIVRKHGFNDPAMNDLNKWTADMNNLLQNSVDGFADYILDRADEAWKQMVFGDPTNPNTTPEAQVVDAVRPYLPTVEYAIRQQAEAKRAAVLAVGEQTLKQKEIAEQADAVRKVMEETKKNTAVTLGLPGMDGLATQLEKAKVNAESSREVIEVLTQTAIEQMKQNVAMDQGDKALLEVIANQLIMNNRRVEEQQQLAFETIMTETDEFQAEVEQNILEGVDENDARLDEAQTTYSVVQSFLKEKGRLKKWKEF